MIEQTLVLVKPDGVQRSLIGRIISRFEDAGMKIIGCKMTWVKKEFAQKHYKAHLEKDFYPSLEKMITSGPVVAIVLQGIDVLENVRKMVGPTEPKSALPGTIRGDFAHHNYEFGDQKDTGFANVVHASGNKEEAKTEVKLWFDESEIFDYKICSEKWTR